MEDIEDTYQEYSQVQPGQDIFVQGTHADIVHQKQIYNILQQSEQFKNYIIPISVVNYKRYRLKKQSKSLIRLNFYLKNNKKVQKITYYRFFLNLCKAVEFIHSKRIVHRNINQETIFIHQNELSCKLYLFKYAYNLRSDEEFIYIEGDQNHNKWSDNKDKQKSYLKDIYSLTQIYDILIPNEVDKLEIIENIKNKCHHPQQIKSQQIGQILTDLCKSIQDKIYILESHSSKKSNESQNHFSPNNSEASLQNQDQNSTQQRQIDKEKKLFENNIKKMQLISDLVINNYSLFKELNYLRLYQIMKYSYKNIIQQLKGLHIVRVQRQYENRIKHLERKLIHKHKMYQGHKQKTCLSMCSMSEENEGRYHKKLSKLNQFQNIDLFTLMVQEFKCLIEEIQHRDLMTYGIWVILQVIMYFQGLFNIWKYTDDDQLKYLYHIKIQYDKYRFSWFEAEEKDIKAMCAQIKKKTYSISDMVI